MGEHRREFDRQLDAIEAKIMELSAMICEDLPAATQALLNGNNELAAPRRAADGWYQRDGSVAPALAEVDHDLDELHASLVADLASGRIALPAAIEMTLVARFYERLGDHAVNIARRVIYLAGSTHAQPLDVFR